MSCHDAIDARYLPTAEENAAKLQLLREMIERSSEAGRLDLAQTMIDAIIDELSSCARHEQRPEECMSLSILSIDIQRYFSDLTKRRESVAKA